MTEMHSTIFCTSKVTYKNNKDITSCIIVRKITNLNLQSIGIYKGIIISQSTKDNKS